MIYFNDNSSTYIPRTSEELGDVVKCENQVTHATFTVCINKVSKYHYEIDIDDFSETCTCGQYNYQVIDSESGKVIECGIAQYGKFEKKPHKEYNIEETNNTYKTYKY